MRLRIALALLLLLSTAAVAQVPTALIEAASGAHDLAAGAIVGSWFGRAVPDNPWCTPGELLDPSQPDLGPCPIPREIIMTPTFFADRSFMGVASHEFSLGGGEAHGAWKPTGSAIEADWVFLEKNPAGQLIGASHMRMGSVSLTWTHMEGIINAYFIPFMGEDGLANIDPVTGEFIPNPLGPFGPILDSGLDCAPPVNGCVGVFTFVIEKIRVE